MLRRIRRYFWAALVSVAIWEGAKVLHHVWSVPTVFLDFASAVIITAVVACVGKACRRGKPAPDVRLRRSVTTRRPENEIDGDYDLVLVAPGDRKIAVIKEIRELTRMGLKETIDLVDNAPALIMRQVTSERAEAAKGLLESQGATVTVSTDPGQAYG